MRNHVEAAFKVLIEQEIVELQELSDSVNRVLLIFLILYIVVLIIFYAIWLFQKANRLNTEVSSLIFLTFKIKVTIKMLNMIPLNVIMGIQSIRSYLMKLAKGD